MRKLLALALASTLLPGLATAKKRDKDDEEEPDPKDKKKDKKADKADKEETSDEEPDEEPDVPDEEPEKPKQPKKEEGAFVKQDLTGHDLAGTSKANVFEKDRFFVDKVDTEKTEDRTLVQGSLTATSFAYKESAGGVLMGGGGVPSGSEFSRLFTELRLQTDFRHIGGGKFDARVDVRARATTNPGSNTTAYTPVTDSSSQSGFLGENELEIRELWLIRSGKKSDFTIGRQFIADLAGVKVDGLRVDYAQSEKFTLLGFGGLYPIRGSRSITTDYKPLLGDPDPTTGVRPDAGKYTGAGGFGAAYRTQNAYGAFGGVVLKPISGGETPRLFGTSTGYWRAGPKIDFYHFAVLDLVGSNTTNAGLTNLSAGLNFKPDQRLRATFSFNRVDTETLNVQAQAFLQNPDQTVSIIQNEAYLIRVANNAARGSLSAGLGKLQRFEVTVATALRFRGDVTLQTGGPTPTDITLAGGKSVEVYGSIVDRRSFKKLRLGLDTSRIFKQGGDSYQRTSSSQYRVFGGRELENGHGEWEAEVSYASAQDDAVGGMSCLDPLTCFGSAKSSTVSLGGNVFYRINRDWLAMGSLFINRQNITSSGAQADPAVTGLSGFVRAAYRF